MRKTLKSSYIHTPHITAERVVCRITKDAEYALYNAVENLLRFYVNSLLAITVAS